jgi:hypothetical protein
LSKGIEALQAKPGEASSPILATGDGF